MGLARLYGALAFGGLDSVDLVLEPVLGRMVFAAAPAGRVDQFLGFADCWGMGVVLNTLGIYGDNARAYGHSGWGGSFGCADPDAGVSIGYVCTRTGPELVGDPLCAAILGAARQS